MREMIKTQKTIPSKSIKLTLITPCGMNCSLCRAYIRENRACPGCYGDDALKPKSRAMCTIKSCMKADAGKFKYCFECKEFPCSSMKRLDKRYSTKYGMSMIDNLVHIKQYGIRNFVKQEKERWACSNCGGLICVHEGNCIFCGHKWR